MLAGVFERVVEFTEPSVHRADVPAPAGIIAFVATHVQQKWYFLRRPNAIEKWATRNCPAPVRAAGLVRTVRRGLESSYDALAMNAYTCKPVSRPLEATVTIPGSKSITNRAFITAAMADGTSILKGILLAEDTRLMIDALRVLGVGVTVDEESCTAEITGCGGRIPEDEAKIFVGNAGTVMRFCTAMVATAFGRYEFDGVERMRQRPIGPLGDALQRLGGGIEYLDREGFPPIMVHAKGLCGGEVTLDSPESSQFVSAILLATPFAGQDVLIEVSGVRSKPYLRMTTAVMDAFGAAVIEQFDDHGAKFIVETPQRYAATTYAVEPDASNANYFLAAAAVAGGRVRVQGLGGPSIQGDVRFIDVLERMGCSIEHSATTMTVIGPEQGKRLGAVEIDLNDMPDMVPTLAVLALFADGPTTIRNVANLRLKETDRIAALRTELTKLGAKVEEYPDGLRITPPRSIIPATIDTYDDHRMAMSFALVGLVVPGMVINNPECCAKTFPDYFQRIEGLTRGND